MSQFVLWIHKYLPDVHQMTLRFIASMEKLSHTVVACELKVHIQTQWKVLPLKQQCGGFR